MDLYKLMLFCLLAFLTIHRTNACMLSDDDYDDEDESEEADEDDSEASEDADEEEDEDCDCDDDDAAEGSDCTSTELKEIMEEVMGESDDPSETAKAIQDKAKEEFGGEFEVICGTNDFAYQNWFADQKMCKTNTDTLYCLAWKD